MKTFITSVLMLAAAITVAITFTIISNNTADELYEEAMTIYNSPRSEWQSASEKLATNWEDHRKFLSASLPKSEIERVDGLISTICELTRNSAASDAPAATDADFYCACKLLCDAFSHMSEILSVSSYSLF